MLPKFSIAISGLLLVIAPQPNHAQNAQISVSVGLARSNAANRPTMGVEYRYPVGEGIGHNWVVGMRASTTLQVPLNIDRMESGIGYYERTDGSSTVNTLMVDIGTRISTGIFQLDGGISIGGVNIAHQRIPPRDANVYSVFGATETFTQPSFAYGGWLSVQLRVATSWLVGIGGTFDYSEHRRTISTNAITGVHYDAVFAGIQPRGVLTIGKDLGTSDIKDTSKYHCWLLATVGSIHPFSQVAYNEFNPGVGVHLRFNPSAFTWFAEAAVYQYSLGDRAVYAGGGAYVDVIGRWLKVGVLAGILSLGNAYGMEVRPALSPRITADTNYGSVSVVFIPVWTDSAFGLTVMLPLF